MSYINDRGQTILQGEEAITGFLSGIKRLREGGPGSGPHKELPEGYKVERIKDDGVLQRGTGIRQAGHKWALVLPNGSRIKFKNQDAAHNFAHNHSQQKPFQENRKLHYRTTFQNLPISIENRRDSIRSGGKGKYAWETKMKHPYGYIKGTEGVDGDALDVFVGPDENAAFAYIAHCQTPDGKEYDEDKIMLGFSSQADAERCFHQHYDDPKFFGGIDAIPMWKFREKVWIKKHTTKKLVASMREGGPGSGPQFKSGSRAGAAAPRKNLGPEFEQAQYSHELERYKAILRNPDANPEAKRIAKQRIDEHESIMKRESRYRKFLARTGQTKTKESNPKTLLEAKGRRFKLYYSRPMDRYGSESESNDLDLIREAFPDDDIVMPKTRRHAELGMDHFHKQINKTRRLIVKPTRKNRLTTGTWSEARHALKRKIPVYAIRKGKIREVQSVKVLKNNNTEGFFGRLVYKKEKK